MCEENFQPLHASSGQNGILTILSHHSVLTLAMSQVGAIHRREYEGNIKSSYYLAWPEELDVFSEHSTNLHKRNIRNKTMRSHLIMFLGD